jgi:Domain of unknown function (DUF4440)
MKRCPTCQSTYTDDSLSFCLTDGATLLDAASFNPQATLPNEFQTTLRDENRATLSEDHQPTLQYPQQHVSDVPNRVNPGRAQPPAGWNSPAWRPAVPQHAPQLRPRNSTPWMVGGLLFLFLVGVIAVWAIIASRKSSGETAARPLIESGNNHNQVANNTNGAPENRNASQNVNHSGTDVDTAPTDPELVLTQLTALEYEWNDANIKGNKAAVRRLLADEFRGVGADGSVKNKEELISTLKPEPSIASLRLSDLKISLAGGTVVLTGLNTAKSTRGQVLRFRFTDTFLWRDGRWQAISSQASQVK